MDKGAKYVYRIYYYESYLYDGKERYVFLEDYKAYCDDEVEDYLALTYVDCRFYVEKYCKSGYLCYSYDIIL